MHAGYEFSLLESAKSGKKRRGKRDLITHLTGKKLTWGQAIQAKCYDCNGMGEQIDCDNLECPLLPYAKCRKKGLISYRPCVKGERT